jgi:hypothetical protein
MIQGYQRVTEASLYHERIPGFEEQEQKQQQKQQQML